MQVFIVTDDDTNEYHAFLNRATFGDLLPGECFFFKEADETIGDQNLDFHIKTDDDECVNLKSGVHIVGIELEESVQRVNAVVHIN